MASSLKLKVSAFCGFAAANDRETAKNGESAAIMAIFRQIPLSFKLSSWSHTAYRVFLGHGGLRGPAVRSCFLIPRRRRDG
jgi:hypothetical protein